MAPLSHQAWLVDLDGTLYAPLPVKLAMAAELLAFGLGSLASVRAFRAEHEQLRKTGGAWQPSPYHVQLERAAAALGQAPGDLESTVVEWMQRRPGPWIRRFRRRRLIRELRAFRAAGGKTALVSDYPSSQKLAALGLSADFDVQVASGEPGGPLRLKPEPDGYLAAAERLGVAPADCLVIGDRDDADGEAARRAGMHFRQV